MSEKLSIMASLDMTGVKKCKVKYCEETAACCGYCVACNAVVAKAIKAGKKAAEALTERQINSRIKKETDPFISRSYKDHLIELNLPEEKPPKKASPEEKKLRTKISRHLKTYTSKVGSTQRKINAEIKQKFGIQREKMTVPILKEVIAYIGETYPIYNKPGIETSKQCGQ